METFQDLLDYASGLDVAEPLTERELADLLHAMATVQRPEHEEHHSHYVVLSSGGRGTSRKPGNIYLNWRRLFDVAPDVGVASIGAGGQNAWVVTLVALYVWNKVYRGSEVELSDAEASVIESLWRSGARTRKMPSDEAFDLTNDLRQARSASILSRRDFERALDNLVSIRCINIIDDRIWLREWVRKRT